MAACDDQAKCVSEACKEAGLRTPDEVAIIGVDNNEMVCDFSFPTISSVALNSEAAGYEAAELLTRLMGGESMNGQVITIKPTHVVTRQSTDALVIEDVQVARAVTFIFEHAREPIQVPDVLRAVQLSRRAFYGRFQKILERSVNQEIRRVRVEIIQRLLTDTDKPIKRITAELGFSSVRHIARYFRAETGMSLQQYRRFYGPK